MTAFTVDNHPSGSILATNCGLRAVLLPAATRTPVTYTFTLTSTAPIVGATTVAFAGISPAPSALAPLLIEDGYVFSFGSALVVAKNDGATPYQEFVAGTAGVIKCQPLIAPLPAASATDTTQGMIELLGLQGIDQTNNTNLISIRSQKSGLGDEKRSTMVTVEVALTGWVHQRDLMMRRILEPANNQSLEIYAQSFFASGKLITGPAYVSNLNFTNQLDDVQKFTCTVGYQGIPVTTYEQ